jgi:hypothetical protein
MESTKFKITFGAHISLEEVQESVATDFGGFGTVSKTDDPRTVVLTGINWPYTVDVVSAQLSALQKDGVLRWEKVP